MIEVGITEMHGIAQEYCNYPPTGVKYFETPHSSNFKDHIFTSSAKGVFDYYPRMDCDLLEAPLFPIWTNERWIYTPADFPTCANFGILGLALPRRVRVKILERIFLKNNFKKLVFKSEFGKQTLVDYANITSEDLLSKVAVVHPAIRKVDDTLVNFNREEVALTFVGSPFFRKGGAHVVDVFESLQQKFTNLSLTICSSDDFKSTNSKLVDLYKNKIKINKNINFGMVSREVLLEKILPATDIFVSPTYSESYGYAIEEAMAFGIPIVATNIAAIPEIVTHMNSGFLLDVKNDEFIDLCRKGIMVDTIPEDFKRKTDKCLFDCLVKLIEDFSFRKNMGMNALTVARDKFSFDTRNSKMLKIYEEALL